MAALTQSKPITSAPLEAAEHLFIHIEDVELQLIEFMRQITLKMSHPYPNFCFRSVVTLEKNLPTVSEIAIDLISRTPKNCKVGLVCDFDHRDGYNGAEIARDVLHKLTARGIERPIKSVAFSGRANDAEVLQAWLNLGQTFDKTRLEQDPTGITPKMLRYLFSE
jgi:hypothetical protein